MPEEKLNTEEKLKSLLYQYVNLYERWSEDRQVFSKKGANLEKTLKAFQSALEQFDTLDQRVREKIIQDLNQILPTVRNAISEAATKSVEKNLQTATQRLVETVEKTEAILKKSRWEVSKSRLMWC